MGPFTFATGGKRSIRRESTRRPSAHRSRGLSKPASAGSSLTTLTAVPCRHTAARLPTGLRSCAHQEENADPASCLRHARGRRRDRPQPRRAAWFLRPFPCPPLRLPWDITVVHEQGKLVPSAICMLGLFKEQTLTCVQLLLVRVWPFVNILQLRRRKHSHACDSSRHQTQLPGLSRPPALALLPAVLVLLLIPGKRNS